MKIHLQVWRQKSTESSGFFETHTVDNITEDMSFFEMLDMLNNNLTQVLDNIGSAVLDNIESMVGNAFNNVTDLSNNQVNRAEFQYSFQLPTTNITWTPNTTNTTKTTNTTNTTNTTCPLSALGKGTK